MTLNHYFLSPCGRISRQEYWLGMIGLMALSIWGAQMLDPTGLTPTADGRIRPPSFGVTLWNLLLAWPTIVVSIKRFNDRDWPFWVGWAVGAAMILILIANYHGMMLDSDRMSGGEKLVMATAAVALTWALVENGFRAGTSGPNRYGDSPLRRDDASVPPQL